MLLLGWGIVLATVALIITIGPRKRDVDEFDDEYIGYD